MKVTAILLAFVFVTAGIGADVCFGQLLKRGYLVAREDWQREGWPTWWTWSPREEMLAPRWYYNAPRWRWILSAPRWAQTDSVSHSLHTCHRFLFTLTVGAWAGLILLLISGGVSN